MQVDGVSFGDVGGLDHYIRALKEMVFLPLARPAVLPAYYAPVKNCLLIYRGYSKTDAAHIRLNLRDIFNGLHILGEPRMQLQ